MVAAFGEPCLGRRSGADAGNEHRTMKRVLDLAGTVLLMLIGWPFLLGLLAWIRLESPGPAIFAQTRIGQGGKPFTCYKLRTMYRDTPDVPTHQVENAALTPLGRRLRRFKLDELPQLYNVLVGDMSLVGPRPCLPMQTELIEARRRLGALAVKPGITGLAQVKGVDMSDPLRLAELDAKYARTQSVTGDLRLMLATMFGEGMNVDRVLRSDG
jgi:O-antigen biosynthesis protein WbqP